MNPGKQFDELVSIVGKLRGPNGCPWDREQTHTSLLPYLLEETYEVIETIDEENWITLEEEIGDLFLHAVFQAKIAEENREFSLIEVLEGISKKLVRRHPHVFGGKKAKGAFHAKQNWEAAKQKEKGRESRLDGVPNTLPALVRAQRIQQKASYVGFDWKETGPVWEKIYEELAELKSAVSDGGIQHIKEELGDVLFTLVNLSRILNISAEEALRKTNTKFIKRFQQVEKELLEQGKSIEEASLEEMDNIWNQVKND